MILSEPDSEEVVSILRDVERGAINIIKVLSRDEEQEKSAWQLFYPIIAHAKTKIIRSSDYFKEVT